MGTPGFDEVIATLKKASAALRDAEVPFVLAGGLASWARGGPESDHDLDFIVKEQDADRALDALAAVGMRPDRPPEDWLYKAFDGDVMVDLIFRPASGPVTAEHFERADRLEVEAVPMLVLALEDVVTAKLLALGEHQVDYESVLEIARSLREQVDWDEVRRRTSDSPYAAAFFTLVEGLGVVERPRTGR
jgi:Uncharacterised nucleotidyltransferase